MDLYVFTEESSMDHGDHVLDQNDLSNGMDHSEDASGTAGYVVARGVECGMGTGDIVSHPDLVGACSFEARKTIIPIAQRYACAKLIVFLARIRFADRKLARQLYRLRSATLAQS